LGEERNERRRLALEMQSVKSDTEMLRGTLDTTNEHVLRLSREVSHLVKGSSSRSSSAGGSTQRLDSLGKELGGQLLNGRSSTRKGHRSPGTSARLLQGRASNIERIEEEPHTVHSDSSFDVGEPHLASTAGQNQVGSARTAPSSTSPSPSAVVSSSGVAGATYLGSGSGGCGSTNSEGSLPKGWGSSSSLAAGEAVRPGGVREAEEADAGGSALFKAIGFSRFMGRSSV